MSQGRHLELDNHRPQLLDRPIWETAGVAAFEDIAEGAQIGALRIEKLLGEGGGGTVYSALDTRLNRLFLARDRLGIRPLCYTRSGGVFLFGSNAKAILGYPGIKATADESMLFRGFVTEDGTEYRDMYADSRTQVTEHTA